MQLVIFLSIFNAPYKRLKIDVIEKEWKNLEFRGGLNKASFAHCYYRPVAGTAQKRQPPAATRSRWSYVVKQVTHDRLTMVKKVKYTTREHAWRLPGTTYCTEAIDHHVLRPHGNVLYATKRNFEHYLICSCNSIMFYTIQDLTLNNIQFLHVISK